MSSTTISTTSTSSPASAGGSSGSGSFLTAGGSTLILAFLAIGLFLGGLLVMFSMRRHVVMNRRRVSSWAAGGGDRMWDVDWDGGQLGPAPTLLMTMMRRQKDFGRKPELWDVCIAKSKTDEWESVVPISAKMVYDDATRSSPGHGGENASLPPAASSEIPSSSQPSTPGHLHPFRIGLHDFADQISALHPFRRPARSGPNLSSLQPLPAPPTGGPDANSPCGGASAAAECVREPSCVQVALAIMLPAERTCEKGVPLYALGVADVQWSGGPFIEPGSWLPPSHTADGDLRNS